LSSAFPTDADAAGERGIVVTSTGYFSEPTVELTWALIHASIRDVAAESSSVRAGGWQRSGGADLAGQVLERWPSQANGGPKKQGRSHGTPEVRNCRG
jgi:lactate dehydrogenase-like 2-hydroxyacid dehydrogenase